MDSVKKSLREFVADLGNENRDFYGSPDGRGLLNVIELTFDHRWVYLYEPGGVGSFDMRSPKLQVRNSETYNEICLDLWFQSGTIRS